MATAAKPSAFSAEAVLRFAPPGSQPMLLVCLPTPLVGWVAAPALATLLNELTANRLGQVVESMFGLLAVVALAVLIARRLASAYGLAALSRNRITLVPAFSPVYAGLDAGIRAVGPRSANASSRSFSPARTC